MAYKIDKLERAELTPPCLENPKAAPASTALWIEIAKGVPVLASLNTVPQLERHNHKIYFFDLKIGKLSQFPLRCGHEYKDKLYSLQESTDVGDDLFLPLLFLVWLGTAAVSSDVCRELGLGDEVAIGMAFNCALGILLIAYKSSTKSTPATTAPAPLPRE
jgi:hypothetical protein